MTAPQKLATTGIIALLLGGALVGASPLVATAEDLPVPTPTGTPVPNTPADETKRCPWLPEDPTGRIENGKLVIEWTVQDPNPYESFIVGYPGTPVDRDARSWVDPEDYRPGVKIRPMLIAICDGSLPDGAPGHASLNTGQAVLIPGGPEIPAEISSSTNQAAYSDSDSDSRADSGSDATAEAEAEGTTSAAASAGSADDAATAASGTSVGTDTSAGTDSSAGTGADAEGGRPASDTHSSAEAENGSSAEAESATHADATTAGPEAEAPTPTTAITEAGTPKQLAETGGPGSSPLLTGIGAAFAALGGTLVAAAARRRRLERETS